MREKASLTKLAMNATKMALVAVLVVASAGIVACDKREMALANVTRFSNGDLFSLVGTDCGPTRCMEVSQGTALAAMGGGESACICKCRRENPAFREDQRICVEHVEECPMAVFGRGTKKPHIPFVFLPLKGQIIYPSKEIVFTDEEDSICAVTSAQYLSSSGWMTLRDLLDNDVPFSLYRDEGSTFLQWRGSAALHTRLEGKLVAVHVLCSAHSPTRLTASCAAFRVAGSSHNTLFDVRSIPFHAGEIVSTEPNQKDKLTVLECLAIGVCVLMLIFIYAAGIIFYINYKQRQRKKDKDPEMSNTMSTEGSIASRIDMDNVMLKTNPLLKMEGLADFGDFGMSGLSDVSEHTEDTLDSSPKNMQKFQKLNGNVISAMVHSRNKKQIKPLSRSASTPERDRISERLQRRSLSPEIERAPHSELSIVDCLDSNMFERHLSHSNEEPVIRRKLYFNPVFFETEHLKNPPPAAVEFLEKIREVMSIAKDKMSSKKYIPNLSDIPEEDSYHSVDLGWDISCARRGRRFSAIGLKRENSRKVHCGGCPGCDREPVPKPVLTRSNSCKSCVSEDYKQRIVRKWLDEVPAPAPRSITTKPVSDSEDNEQQRNNMIPKPRVSSPKPVEKEETKSPKAKAPPIPTKDAQVKKENIQQNLPQKQTTTDREPKIIDHVVKKKNAKEVNAPSQKEIIKQKEDIKRKNSIKQDELFKQNISKYLDSVVFNNIQKEKDIVKEKMSMMHDFDELNNDMFNPKSSEFSGVFITKEILKERDIHIQDIKKDIKRLREEKDSVKQHVMKRNESNNGEDITSEYKNKQGKESAQNDNRKKTSVNKYLEVIKKDLNKLKDDKGKNDRDESTRNETVTQHMHEQINKVKDSHKQRVLLNEAIIKKGNEKLSEKDAPKQTAMSDIEESNPKETNKEKDSIKSESAKQSKFKDFIKQIDEVLKSKDSGNKSEESPKSLPVKSKPTITKDMISPPNSAIPPVLIDDIEKKSPTSNSVRRIRKKLPPPPPPPAAKPREVIKPVSLPVKEDDAPIPPEVKIKMEAVIKEFNYCRRAEPASLEDLKTECIEPIPPKIIIPVVAADTYYFSDDNLIIEPQRKHSFVQHEPFVDLDNSERMMLKSRRFSLACGPELALRENIVYPDDIQTARDTLRRGWREVRKAVESHHFMAPPRNTIAENNSRMNEVYIESDEPFYDVIAKPGPLTIEVRGSPVEKRRNICDEFDPDTLDRKLMKENKKRVEKIFLKSGGSFKHKNSHENIDIITEPPVFTRQIGSLRQMYEEKAKLMEEQNMRIPHYGRRGSVPYGNELASMVTSVHAVDMTRHLGARREKPPVPPKQRRPVVEVSPKFCNNAREPQPNEKRRGPEERERYSQYLKAENVIARRSGRRSNRTRSRRTDLRKLYRTEDSGYLSTDSNDSKRRASYLMQMRSRTSMLDQSAMANSPTVIRTPMLQLQHIESDTDDLESVCDGRSESGGESIETDSVFFGNFDDSKQMLAELGMNNYDVHRKLNNMHEQIDSGFMGETNIILSGDSDSEHRSVISIMTGRDGRASSAAIIEERPFMPCEL